MSVKTLRLSDLANLSADEREAQLSAFVAARSQPLNGEFGYLDGQLGEFEKRYETSSAKMRDRLARGEVRETAELCIWMMILEARDALVSHPAG